MSFCVRTKYSTTAQPNQPAGEETSPAPFAARCATFSRRICRRFCSRSRFLAATAFCAFSSSSAVRITSGLGGTKQPIKLKYISTFCRLSPVDLSASWTTTFSINSLSTESIFQIQLHCILIPFSYMQNNFFIALFLYMIHSP